MVMSSATFWDQSTIKKEKLKYMSLNCRMIRTIMTPVENERVGLCSLSINGHKTFDTYCR